MRLWQWAWMWLWLAGLGAIEAGGKVLGTVGERQAWAAGLLGGGAQCLLSSQEPKPPPLSLLSTLLSCPSRPERVFSWRAQLIFEKFLEQNQVFHSHTKALWPGRDLGLPLSLGVGGRGLLRPCETLLWVPSTHLKECQDLVPGTRVAALHRQT